MGEVEQSRARLEAISACIHIDTDAARQARTCVVGLGDLRILLTALADCEAECETHLSDLRYARDLCDRFERRADRAEAQVADLTAKVAGLVEAAGPFVEDMR